MIWPPNLTGEETEGFLADELNSMGPHARSKTELRPDPVSGSASSTKRSASSSFANQFYFPALKQMHKIGEKKRKKRKRMAIR